MRRKYQFGVGVESDRKTGSDYQGTNPMSPMPIFGGKNLEVDPPHKLVQSFNALWSDDAKSEGTSRVTWEVKQIQDSCMLTVTHDQLPEDASPELYGG